MAAPESGLSLPRRLASVDKKVRDKAVDLLERWLVSRQSVDEADLKKIWKGLFYCYWHTDKANVQSELAERFSSLLLRIPTPLGVQFFAEFMGTMRREWGGIDHLRMDKFYVLQRKFVAGMLRALEKNAWDRALVGEYTQALKSRNLLAGDFLPSLGSSMHIAEVFLGEVLKVAPDSAEVFGLLLEPFFEVLALSPDKLLVKRVKESVFDRLVAMTEQREMLCEMILRLPVESKLIALGSAPGTLQGNRKLLYSLYESFRKLKKLAGCDASIEKRDEACKSPAAGEVVSKLESKFDDVAADSLPPLEMVQSPLIAGGKRKARAGRRKSALEQGSGSGATPDEASLGGGSSPGEKVSSSEKKKRGKKTEFVAAMNTASKKRKSSSNESPEMERNSERKKKVRFALKQNAVWQLNNPRVAAPKRYTPSTSTPKRSSLKKGLLPGPIKFSPKKLLKLSPKNNRRASK